MQGHVIVCGLGHVGYRIARLLLHLGEQVAVVTLDARGEWRSAIEGAGACVFVGDARNRKLLEAAGLGSAKSLIAATHRDAVNIEVALDARRLRPGLPVVARLFDQALARELEPTLGLRRALSVSALAAPAFAAAALGDALLASFRFDGKDYAIGRLPPREPGSDPEEPRDPVPQSLFALGKSGADRVVIAERPSWRNARPRFAAERGPAVARHPGPLISDLLHPITWLGFFARVFRDAPLPLRTISVVLVALFAFSIAVFSFGLRLSPVDALYFVITTVTTTGYGDINLRDSPTALKLYGCLVMLLGTVAFGTLLSMLTDFFVKSRFREFLSGQRVPRAGHVVVAGLGNLGYRIVEELRREGERSVGIDLHGGLPFAEEIREGSPLVFGDGRLPETLSKAGVPGAKAVLAVTGDDAANLGIALAARRANRDARCVARLFDADFAHKVEEALGIHAALSASRLAAPAFVANALEPDVVAAYVSDETLHILLDTQTRPEWIGRSPEELAKANVRILLRGGKDTNEPLAQGERMLVLLTRGPKPRK